MFHTRKVNYIPSETFIKVCNKKCKMKDYDLGILMNELLNKDRLEYMRVILNLGGSARSIDITKALLASRGITGDKKVKKENIMVNKRLKNLVSLEILKQVGQGEYGISSLGYLLMDSWKELTEKMETFGKFRQFFETHFVNDLPEEFFRQIYKLRNAKLTESPVQWMEELARQTIKTRRKLYILTELLHSISEETIERKKSGKIEEIVIIYEFYQYPNLNLLKPNEKEFFDKLVDAGVEFRHLTLENSHPIGLRIVDERWATFGLTRIADGVLDREKGFIGSDSDFIAWCRDLMYHIWSFKAEKLNVEEVMPKKTK